VKIQDYGRFLVAITILLAACGGNKQDEEQTDITDVSVETATRESCPDGLVWWEDYNVCAPQVDECVNPWELPLVGGGCVAIGPRGCPKLWNPDADVDCESGELMDYDGMACPEGFVLMDDEVACIPFFAEDGACGEMEIPVLGGGCKKIGPEWGVEGEPYFDECPDGHLALKGGGCVQVGPRACPKLWDPEADVDCEVGDVLPCPEGWSESEDGMYCDPMYAECPFGERALVGGACERVIPLAEDCPEGPFPDVPDGATDVVYVLADSTCTENCGTQLAPYSSIQEAIDVAPDGSHVLVGAGIYDEGLLIQKPVTVVGLCAAKVTVAGIALIPDEDSKIPSAGIAVLNTESVTLKNLQVISLAVGLMVVEATDVEVSDMELTGVAGAGMFVGEDAEVSASDIWVHDIVASEDVNWMKGQGVWIQDGGELEVERGLVEGTKGTGCYVKSNGSNLSLANSIIRTTSVLPEATLGFGKGYGVSIRNGGKAVIQSSLVSNNSYAALSVANHETLVQAIDSVFRNTKSINNEQNGWGLKAFLGSTVIASNSLFIHNSAVGMRVHGDKTNVTVSRSSILSTIPTAGVSVGLHVTDGSQVSVFGSSILHHPDTSVVLNTSSSSLDFSGCLIGHNVPDQNLPGKGIEFMSGGQLTIHKSVLEKVHNVSILSGVVVNPVSQN
jgi:hypothetical protein